MTFSILIQHGRFGEAVHELMAREHAACESQDASGWANAVRPVAPGTRVLVALGTPDIPLLQRVCESYREARVVGVFLFERYLVVTPVFGPGQTCCECFLRRFLSQPPYPYTVEASEALVNLAGVQSGHESLGFTAMTVRTALELAYSQWDGDSERCVLVDMTGTAHQSARLVALHGCVCRLARGASLASPDRFVNFQKELKQWPAQA